MANRAYPMGSGLETDMVTGEPLAVEAIDRDARRQELRSRQEERHQRLLQDLSGHGGEVLKDVAERLAMRIEQLIADDPEARTLRQLLERMEVKLAVGERIAMEALRTILPEDHLTG